MLLRVLYGAAALLSFIAMGCASGSSRDRAFTDDWADHLRRRPHPDRRLDAASEGQEEQRLGPATVTRDESGRPQVNIGGLKGLGVDVGYKGGPSGRIRYKYEWDFARPERKR